MGHIEVLCNGQTKPKYLNKLVAMATAFIGSCEKVNEMLLSSGYTFYTTLVKICQGVQSANKI